jgi:NADPH:quinone reductase-like Zn-dependent oxidoreductase
MKYSRIICSRLGGPEVLVLAEEDLRDPRAGEVRVRTLAAGVAWADCMMRRGSYPGQPRPPFTPGYDVVGVVDQCGRGATRCAPGQTVSSLTVRGGYSEYIYLPEDELVPVPPGLDPAEAVSLVLNYVTAYQMLHRAVAVRTGDRILVHSAAGGVGTALLQLARLQGLRVLGTASAGKHELVQKLGGEPIDYRAEPFEEAVHRMAPAGVQAAFDPIGGWHWLRSRRCVAAGGSVIAYGSQGAGKLEDVASFVLLSLWRGRRFAFYSITAMKQRDPEDFRQDLSALIGLLAERRIEPVIGARLPWKEAARANEMLETGAVQGKIVLTF